MGHFIITHNPADGFSKSKGNGALFDPIISDIDNSPVENGYFVGDGGIKFIRVGTVKFCVDGWWLSFVMVTFTGSFFGNENFPFYAIIFWLFFA